MGSASVAPGETVYQGELVNAAQQSATESTAQVTASGEAEHIEAEAIPQSPRVSETATQNSAEAVAATEEARIADEMV